MARYQLNLLVLAICLLGSMLTLKAEAQIRADFTYARTNQDHKSGYGAWVKTPTSLVYNLSAGSEVVLYSMGMRVVYKSVMDAERKNFGNSNIIATIMLMLDPKGKEKVFTKFPNGDVVIIDQETGGSMMFSNAP